jgi:SAM-dependent methyltransferase
MNSNDPMGTPENLSLAKPLGNETVGTESSVRVSHPACTNCGGVSTKAFSVKDLNWQLSEQIFTYYRCRSCGLIFLWPIPGDLGPFYPLEYYGEGSPLDAMRSYAGMERGKIDLVKQFSQGNKLLELGPGKGGFAYLAKEAGFEVDAIEMSAQCCRNLIEFAGVRAINETDTEAAIWAGGYYDVIVAWHVIEHLPHPWGTVEAAAARLEPGGILVFATPKPSSFQFKVLGRKWPHVDAPRHLQLIPISVLEQRAEGLGLRPVLVTTKDEGAIHWNRFGWDRSIPNILPRRPRRFFGPASARIASWCSSLFSGIEASGLRGSAYTAIFRKV